METELDLDAERVHRVRTTVIDQAVGLDLAHLARAADTVMTREELFEAAVNDLCVTFGSDREDVALAVTVGILIGSLCRELT